MKNGFLNKKKNMRLKFGLCLRKTRRWIGFLLCGGCNILCNYYFHFLGYGEIEVESAGFETLEEQITVGIGVRRRGAATIREIKRRKGNLAD